MVQVLIVDDEYGIRTSLSGVLEDEGYETSAVESGEDCLQALAERQFDVVLLDIWLPGIDGLEVLQRVRALENHPEIIMISGHGNIETAVKATKLGAYDFLEKPLSVDKTLIVVKNAAEAASCAPRTSISNARRFHRVRLSARASRRRPCASRSA